MNRHKKISFYESQKFWNSPLNPDWFEGDLGNGVFGSKSYPFILANPDRNLWSGIREDAIHYFNGIGLGMSRAEGLSPEQIAELEADGVQCTLSTDIQFWRSGGIKAVNGKACKLPTGHVLSSQVACINHLFPLIRDKEASTRLLHGLDIRICEALPVNVHERGNYVEFEVVGGGSYLNEETPGKPLNRGANCTSIDAVMKGRTRDNEIVLFLIEWKYVEQYKNAKSKWDGSSGLIRQKRYRSFFAKDNTPFTFCNSGKKDSFFHQLFTEPYYQLMRQTLLGWHMVLDSERNGGATSFEHVVVIPSCNSDMRQLCKPLGSEKRILAENWNALIKKTVAFVDPQQLFEPITQRGGRADWLDYLAQRYWLPSFTIAEVPPIRQYDCIRLVRNVEFVEDGKRLLVPKGTIGTAVEIRADGETYEFDCSLVIPHDDGTLDSEFVFFSVNAEDVEIAHCHQTQQYYPPK